MTQTDRGMALQAAIDRIGGPTAVAKHFGITSQAVSQWREAPLSRVMALSQLAGMPAHELRPDFFTPQEAAE